MSATEDTVVDESLRLYPPIWAFTRDPVNDDEIGGYHIPAGSTIVLSPYATQRHRDFWDDPEAFVPERFAPERAKSVAPFSPSKRMRTDQEILLH